MSEAKTVTVLTQDLMNAQVGVLGSMLIDEECVGFVLSRVSERDFVTQQYGLIDEVMAMDGVTEPGGDPAAFVAASDSRYLLTATMRQKYRDHLAADREAAAKEDKAKRALARIRSLANY